MTLPVFFRALMRPFGDFGRDVSGVALVEFAIQLPILLFVFAFTIESARTFWSYQAAVAGVRDATRYLARTTSPDLCGAVSAREGELKVRIEGGLDGGAVFPSSVSLDEVRAACVERIGASVTYRGGSVAVATVTARLTVSYPFSGLFSLVDVSLGALTTEVADSSRIYGE